MPSVREIMTSDPETVDPDTRVDEVARMMAALTPETLVSERIFYLDSAGMLLSLLNHLRKGKGVPSKAPILVWDRLFIPVSRLVDPLFGHRLGKTVVSIWRKPAR